RRHLEAPVVGRKEDECAKPGGGFVRLAGKRGALVFRQVYVDGYSATITHGEILRCGMRDGKTRRPRGFVLLWGGLPGLVFRFGIRVHDLSLWVRFSLHGMGSQML